jgi:stress response protein SCP2
VWIDPVLIDCPLPSQQRSASEGLFNVARGTRLPIDNHSDDKDLDDMTKDTLRLFVYWVGRDIDLSATFHNEEGEMIEQVSYTHLKSKRYQAYHSGDITNAKKGASEFVDINLPVAAKHARYLAMNVLVYRGSDFADHETCFVGWMMRAKPNSNEIYDPKTVQQKLDLTQTCRNVIPVVFDLQQRKAIWTDLPASQHGYSYTNNVENNYASIEQKLKAIVNSQHKLSLYELLELHAQARGEQVETRDEADMIFAFDGTVTPFDVNTINAEYVV